MSNNNSKSAANLIRKALETAGKKLSLAELQEVTQLPRDEIIRTILTMDELTMEIPSPYDPTQGPKYGLRGKTPSKKNPTDLPPPPFPLQEDSTTQHDDKTTTTDDETGDKLSPDEVAQLYEALDTIHALVVCNRDLIGESPELHAAISTAYANLHFFVVEVVGRYYYSSPG